jgi:RHH-type rel operon transcriptional repressor/antitoxin RelB
MLYLYSKRRVPVLAIRLPDSIEKRLAKLAKRTGRTKTFYAREAILRHLEDLEAAYEADRRLERIRSGKDKPIALEDVMKRYGLAD